MMTSGSEDTENGDVFYFESDHLALRGNVDYSELLKTLFILEAQRNRAIRDYNVVLKIRNECMKDPLNYHENRQNGSLGLPEMQEIAEIPKIDWSKYENKVPAECMRQIDVNCDQKNDEKLEERSTTKMSWSLEEQRKLEELLVKYPPENQESKRIAKIAEELGTRTKAQVASRLQKYYLKLLKAGLPIPGPMPKCKSNLIFRSKKLTNSYKMFEKPTTFFPETVIPVAMEDEHAPGPSNANATFEKVTTGEAKGELMMQQRNYLMTNDYHVTERRAAVKKDEDALHVDILKAVKAEKLLETPNNLHRHFGYRCDYCDEEPIHGARWHCIVCVNESIDYCNDCMISQLYSREPHDSRHKFAVIRNDKEIAASPWSDDDDDDNEDEDEDLEDITENNEDEEEDTTTTDRLSEKSNNEEEHTISRENIKMRKVDYDESRDVLKVSEQCPVDIFDVDDAFDVVD